MGNTTRVGITQRGQYLITLPKSLALAMRLKKGDELEFLFDKGDVVIRKI